MSSTQLAKKMVTIGIYRYLTIYRATLHFTSLLGKNELKVLTVMNGPPELFLFHLQNVKYNIRLQIMSSGIEPHFNINMTHKRHTMLWKSKICTKFHLQRSIVLFCFSHSKTWSSLMLRSNACGRRVELMRTKLCGNLIKINTVINNLHNENYARNAPPVGKLK